MQSELTEAIYKLLWQNCRKLDSALVWRVSDIHAIEPSELSNAPYQPYAI